MSRACVVLLCAAAACSHTEQVKPSSGTTESAQASSSGEQPDGGAKSERSGGLVGQVEHPRSKVDFPPGRPAQPGASAANVKTLALPPSEKPLVTIALRFTSGAVDDPAGKAGITDLAARVMSEGGTQALDAKSLLVALFPMATSIDSRADKGKSALSELMYRGHPYGRLTEGHVSELKKLTLDEVKAHAARVFTADRLVVGVSGGYPRGLPERAAAAVAGLPARGPQPVDIPEQKPQRPRFLLIEKEAEASAISCGFPWQLSRGDSDWPAMSVARSAFGEHRQYNGRLMQRLREQRGLNYGDYAYIEYFEQQQGGNTAAAQTGRARHQQDFTIWVRPVQNENRLFALRAALYELSRSVDAEPFGDDEVEQTKGFLDGYILLFDQTDSRKLGYALDDDFLGVPEFLRRWRAAVRGVSARDVNAAWKRWMKPEQLQCVVVGPRMDETKRVLLSDAPTPMHYQADAQGNVPEKSPELLASDRAVNAFSFGARGDQDVLIVPVQQMFE